jgi:hypothetical protein
MTKPLSRRFRIQLPESEYQRLEVLATRAGNTVMREAVMLLHVGIRVAERRWAAIDGDGTIPHIGRGELYDKATGEG